MHTIRLFLKRPTTWVGVVTALMFQLIFAVIWMTGYDGVNDRLDHLRIGIVNEDPGIGAQVARELQTMLPTKSETFSDSARALAALNERQLQMVVLIPAGFTEDAMADDKTATIDYWLNDSNPSMIRSTMTGIASQVTAAANKAASMQGIGHLLIQSNMAEGEAAAYSKALSERVTGNVIASNAVNGTNSQMVPMMLLLASYVGAMIMSMNMEQSSKMLASQAGRWQRFVARGVINVAAAIAVSLLGSALVTGFDGSPEQGFMPLWGLLFLIMLAFLFMSQLFLIVLGMAGMLLNIVALSAQLVSSGAMVPRELLSGFYRGIGEALPATYAVEGTMNVMFGGPGIGGAAAGLAAIAFASLAIAAAGVALMRGRRGLPQPAPNAAAHSRQG